MTQTITIATRESKLAMWQAEFIRDQLRAAHADLKVEILGMTTKGDKWLSAPLSEVGGKGLFVKELETAMADGRADIAVHSAKDLPAALPPGFSLPVLAYRADVRDVLVGVEGGLDTLPQGARVGSSSLRRRTQLLEVRPDLNISSVRGNVGTRLSKLDAGEYDAIVLAAAGLNRLAIERSDVCPLDVSLSLPAPGQGALGIECRDDEELIALLNPLRDEGVERCVSTERAISFGMGADCSLPIAALAHINEVGDIVLQALVGNADGTKILRAQASGSDPHTTAQDALAQLNRQGAQDILAELRS